ncbi:mitochondrial NADH:ubiquinone oxidoreductase 13kD-like subunit [Dunaliella salina]|uniref:Mitochondrial NADH:ubiquinone oxidoreductase 13kD-like subunit n=1 Tax=Dunaliella salina TaxID=3046 RepID=A0ABQ7GFX9_DUNSA|nr:mitochondrial NADH:ubiquinone oxidoreductase 13kD-like subunit [Dunaliella salina]|eukprot:KAF5833507.1 mitochondrial NADH:ubiquinone oxidoreductase 13kD-like subunit [Dunaliella salina]
MTSLLRASRLLPQLLSSASSFASPAPYSAAAAASFASKSPATTPDTKKDVYTPVPKATADTIPTTIGGGQAFPNDLRSTSGLGAGDGIVSHTEKWMHSDRKSPMQYIQEQEPILVEGPVVASYGSDDPALGCPVEFINLKGTSYENPAVCKYTGNKYYSLPHTWKAH